MPRVALSKLMQLPSVGGGERGGTLAGRQLFRGFGKGESPAASGLTDHGQVGEHYLFGLYSKFVASGAKRISSDYGTVATVTNVAFLNPDGTIVVVVANQTAATQQFALLSEGNQVWSQIPAKTAATFVCRSGLGKSSLPAAPPN